MTAVIWTDPADDAQFFEFGQMVFHDVDGCIANQCRYFLATDVRIGLQDIQNFLGGFLGSFSGGFLGVSAWIAGLESAAR